MGWSEFDPSDFAKKMVQDTEKSIETIVVDLTTNLTFTTPVNNGDARSNFIVTSGAPTDEINESSIDKSGSASVESAKALKATLGVDAFVNNNLSYIGHLENGTENMAPFAMVRRSIQSVVRKHSK